MAYDPFIDRRKAPSDPITSAVAITPSDSDTFTPTADLYVGGAGTISLVLRDDTAAISIVIDGPCRLGMSVKAVKAAGTTATQILALY